jgi:hypothetical protein
MAVLLECRAKPMDQDKCGYTRIPAAGALKACLLWGDVTDPQRKCVCAWLPRSARRGPVTSRSVNDRAELVRHSPQ